MRAYAKNAAFFAAANTNPELVDGRTLALYSVSGPDDVHYPAWEMHPEGDELLIVVSGSLSVEFRNESSVMALPSRSACRVPAGIWHRLIVHEPSVLIAITPRLNTIHDEG
jgi:mannose-6-phosphate isomerase-like protein (cupin superfamily)